MYICSDLHLYWDISPCLYREAMHIYGACLHCKAAVGHATTSGHNFYMGIQNGSKLISFDFFIHTFKSDTNTRVSSICLYREAIQVYLEYLHLHWDIYQYLYREAMHMYGACLHCKAAVGYATTLYTVMGWFPYNFFSVTCLKKIFGSISGHNFYMGTQNGSKLSLIFLDFWFTPLNQRYAQ